MIYLLVIAVAVLLIGVALTISASKDNDENYGKKGKTNVVRLTSIYGVVIILSLIILGLYIANV